jgi:Fe2+ transport system protein FeoA
MKLGECDIGEYILTRIPQGVYGDKMLFMGLELGEPINVVEVIDPITITHDKITISINKQIAEKIAVEKKE